MDFNICQRHSSNRMIFLTYTKNKKTKNHFQRSTGYQSRVLDKQLGLESYPHDWTVNSPLVPQDYILFKVVLEE